jgi:hypothetical protein
MWMKTLAAITALFLVACGDDSTEANDTTGSNNVRFEDNNRSPNNVSSNNASSNNASSNNGVSNNGVSNNGVSNNGSSNNTTGTNNTTGGNNGAGITAEAEPNDDRDTANMVSFGDTVSGVLESGGQDTFVLTATAGRILEVEILAADPSFNISMFVEGATSDIGDRRFDFDNVAGSKRQYFLPKNDTWYVTLQSLEAIDWDYTFVVREVTPTPMTNAFSATVAGDLNDGAVDVYELPSANGEIVARLDAERLADGSDLDSVMYVYSPSVGFVTFNDDASTSTDSELTFSASTGTTYWLVVDAWRLGAANPYELTIQVP